MKFSELRSERWLTYTAHGVNGSTGLQLRRRGVVRWVDTVQCCKQFDGSVVCSLEQLLRNEVGCELGSAEDLDEAAVLVLPVAVAVAVVEVVVARAHPF